MTATDRCAKVPERIVDNCKAIVQERERVLLQHAPLDGHVTLIRPVHVDPPLKVLVPTRRIVPRQEPDFVSLTAFECVSKRMHAHLVEMWIQDEQASARFHDRVLERNQPHGIATLALLMSAAHIGFRRKVRRVAARHAGIRVRDGRP